MSNMTKNMKKTTLLLTQQKTLHYFMGACETYASPSLAEVVQNLDKYSARWAFEAIKTMDIAAMIAGAAKYFGEKLSLADAAIVFTPYGFDDVFWMEFVCTLYMNDVMEAGFDIEVFCERVLAKIKKDLAEEQQATESEVAGDE